MDSWFVSYIHERTPNLWDRAVRIEILVLITAALFVLCYVLDMFRHRFVNQVLQFFLIMLGALPKVLIVYTIGFMQLTTINNEVYDVWALVLVTLQYSIRAVRHSSLFHKQNPLQDVMMSLWTANLLGARSTLLVIPLWLLWSLNSIRIILGFADTEFTSNTHRRNLRLLTEYMRTEHKHTPLKDCDARNMNGYNYLVRGEDKQKIKSDAPDYRIQLEVTTEKKFITVNKIWKQNGKLLGNLSESNELKDLCLAFALFKLLCRQFFYLPIHEADQPKTRNFVLKGLINNDNYDRAFQIVEAELAFVYDFFYTRYAVILAGGFPKLRLVLSLSVIGVASYLALNFYHSRAQLAGELSKTTNGISATCILLVILTMKEIWEMVTYVLSDWTKVVLVSNYVQKPWWTRYPPIVTAVKFLCKYKLANRWHGVLWQHNLLQSFNRFKPYLHVRSYFLGSRELPGNKEIPGIAVPKEVKQAIVESLEYLCNQPEALEKYLSTAANSLHFDFEQNFLPIEFETEAQKILVWHVATCYCKIKLASILSQSSPTFYSFTSPFMLENFESLEEGLESHYKAAMALSQYSAHLLELQLVPGRGLTATELHISTIVALKSILFKCRSWENVLKKLELLADKKDDADDANEERQKRARKCPIFPSRGEWQSNASRLKKGKIILKIGVRIGRALSVQTGTDTIPLWKFLKKFWAGYLLYLAASVSPQDHKKSLFRGGEFLTHIWALLSHAGIIGNAGVDCSLSVDDLSESDELDSL